MKKEPLYLIDAYAQIYRSYFAFISRPLRNRDGKNISALFGFAKNLINLINVQGAKRLIVVFDSRVPTFRHKQYPLYKATRNKAPEDLHAQVPLVEEFLSALKVASVMLEGYEADDIIATLAGKCKAEKRECFIVSGDKDLLQLTGDGVWQLRPAKKDTNGKQAYEKLGPIEVRAEWGVQPNQILDLLSLTGDSADNVPGVKGIGDKSAVKLIDRYGSLDEIYANLSGISGSLGTKLASGKDDAYLSRSLITLVSNLTLPNDNIDSFSVENIDENAKNAAAAVLLREDMNTLAAELTKSGKQAGEVSPALQPPTASSAAPSAGTPRNTPYFVAGGGVAGAAAPALGGSPQQGAGVGGAPPHNSSQGTYSLVTDVAELEKLLAAAMAQGWLALDFETDLLDAWHAKPVGFSVALKPESAYYVTIAEHAGGNAFIPPGAARALLAPVFQNPAMTVIAHNAKFDYEVSRAWGLPRWKCKIFDTMTAAWLCDSARSGYSLEALAKFHLGAVGIAYNDIVPKNGTFTDVPVETACKYSGEDADFCLRLKILFEEKLKTCGAPDLFNGIEMPLLPVLAEMEGTGILIETGVLKRLSVEFTAELDTIQAEIWRLAGHEFNINSPKQLQEVLFVERGLQPGKKTQTGYSTDVSVLEELAREDKMPELILRHRTLSKLKNTYIDTLGNLADKNGRVHTSFIQTGTATGRLSSRDPNLQNIPIRAEEGRRIREAFVAPEGSVLISADYSQIELVILAHLSGDPMLTEAFKSGKDVHAKTAALIFGLMDESLVDASQRRMAKVINFGVMYGMSAFRLSNELGIKRSAAAEFIDAYFKTYSGVKRYIDNLVTETERTGYAQTLLGRRRAIPTINSANKTERAAAQRVAVNTPIQGSAADIVKKAMLNMDAALAPYPQVKMLLQVHDELILECPEADAPKIAALVRSVMETAVPLTVPLRVSVETGRRWGDFH
ncbi:DNA polymerase I [Spirochaetia bacterium]|nr:DNA polymerase I [Spirochaetia bacterium]